MKLKLSIATFNQDIREPSAVLKASARRCCGSIKLRSAVEPGRPEDSWQGVRHSCPRRR
jgi:hypothetical protein